MVKLVTVAVVTATYVLAVWYSGIRSLRVIRIIITA